MSTQDCRQAGRPDSPPLQRFPNPPQRILLVDAEPMIRHLGTAVLMCSGYRVDTAKDGTAAWEALHADSYDLLITDNNLPKLSGLELLEKVHVARLGLPAILMSGAMPAIDQNCPWLQLVATLLKPFPPAELLGTVRRVLDLNDGVSQTVSASSRPPNPAVGGCWPVRPGQFSGWRPSTHRFDFLRAQ